MNALTQLSLDQLQNLIDAAVERKFMERFGVQDTRRIDEILESIDHNRWTPPPDAPSNLELLREDREGEQIWQVSPSQENSSAN